MIKYVNIQNILFEIDTDSKIIKPVNHRDVNLYYKSRLEGVTYKNFYDTIVVVNKNKTWMKSIPMPIFIENIMSYIDSDYAKTYAKDKKEFMSDYLYSNSKREAFETFKSFWTKCVDLSNVILNAVELMLCNAECNWNLTHINQLKAESWKAEARVGITDDEYETLRNSVGDTKSSLYFKSYLPAMRVAGFNFLDEDKPTLKNACFGFVQAFDREIKCKSDNPYIGLDLPDEVYLADRPFTKEEEDLLQETINFNQLGRKYLIYSKGDFYVNDYKNPRKNMSIRDFLLELIKHLDDAESNKDLYSEQRKNITNRGEFNSYRYIIDRNYSSIRNNKMYVICEPHDWSNYSYDLRVALQKCDEAFKSQLKDFDIRKTDFCIFMSSLCDFVKQHKNVNDIYDILYKFVNDNVVNDLKINKVRKVLSEVYSDEVIDIAIKTVYAILNNEELPATKNVNISLARIGEDVGNSYTATSDMIYEFIDDILFCINRRTGNITIPAKGGQIVITANIPNYHNDTSFLYKASVIVHDTKYNWYKQIPVNVLFTRLGKHYNNEPTQRALALRNKGNNHCDSERADDVFWYDYVNAIPFESYEFLHRFFWNIGGHLNYTTPMLSSSYKYLDYKEFDNANEFLEIKDSFKLKEFKIVKEIVSKYCKDFGLKNLDLCTENFKPLNAGYKFYKHDNVPMYLPERSYSDNWITTERLAEGEPDNNFFNYPEMETSNHATDNIVDYLECMLDDMKLCHRYVDKLDFEIMIHSVIDYPVDATDIPSNRYKITRDFLDDMISKLETCIADCNKDKRKVTKNFNTSRLFAEQIFALVSLGREDLIEEFEGIQNNISKQSLAESVNEIRNAYSEEVVNRVYKLLNLNNETIEDEKWL